MIGCDECQYGNKFHGFYRNPEDRPKEGDEDYIIIPHHKVGKLKDVQPRIEFIAGNAILSACPYCKRVRFERMFGDEL